MDKIRFLISVRPRIKIWREWDGHMGVTFRWNDPVMRILTKMYYSIHIEFANVKICIFSRYTHNEKP